MKTNGNNGTSDPIAQALSAAERKIEAAHLAFFGDQLMEDLRNFCQRHPQGAVDEMVTVIRERTDIGIAAVKRVARQTLAVVSADLFHVKVSDAEARDMPAQPRDQIDKNLPALRRNSWGSRIVDDLAMLSGSFCRYMVEHGHQCDRLLIGETITRITPASVTATAPDGTEREISRVKLVRDHREIAMRNEVHEPKIIVPLMKLIEETEKRLAAGESLGTGIIQDWRE